MAKYPQDVYGVNMVDSDYELLRTGMEKSESGFAESFEFCESENGWKLLRYKGDDAIVIIPAFYQNKKITDMSNDVFVCNGNIKKVFFPNTLRIVGGLKNCTGVERVVVPFGVKSVYAEAFAGCTSLKSLDLPDSATDLGYCFCENCASLETVELSEKLRELPDRSFKNCASLFGVNIPYVLESVGDEAFCGCVSLREIELPVHIKSIGDYAFAFTRPKRLIVLPNCEYIGKKAFFNKRPERFEVLIAEKNKNWSHAWKKGCVVRIHPSIKDTLYDD